MPRLRTLILDLAENGKVGTPYEEILERRLKTTGLWDEGNLFRAIRESEENMRNLKEHGTDHPRYDSLLALSHDEVFVNPDVITIFNYAGSLKGPSVITVYNGSKLNRTHGYAYRFVDTSRKRDALLAVLRVRWEEMDRDRASAIFFSPCS